MPRIPYGFEQIAVSSTAIGPTTATINKPNRAGAEFGLFRTSTDVRWRDDGTAPTAAAGYLLKAGEELVYDGNLETIRFIRVGADAVVDCSYYA